VEGEPCCPGKEGEEKLTCSWLENVLDRLFAWIGKQITLIDSRELVGKSEGDRVVERERKEREKPPTKFRETRSSERVSPSHTFNFDLLFTTSIARNEARYDVR
jgi:hypothetical protein